MTLLRNQLVSKIYRDQDPFIGFPKGLYTVDMQGWNSQHPILQEVVSRTEAPVVVEIGVWKGGSTIQMAKAMERAGVDGVIVAVDTWLGSPEHWMADNLFSMLRLEHGRPSLMQTFMSNVVEAGVEQYILPLPIDSLNAAYMLQRWGLRPDVIHLDAAHEYEAVLNDLKAWWPLLKPGGIFIGDDYSPTGAWVGVLHAFDDFFSAPGLPPIEHRDGKCWIPKPA
ncbi:class I SAM-dependent methyltransferase [Rhodopila sp.]|jgi:hypothetical protein|uniref:class I SAM-dependent methyltransferase n=1 Tax=Rhodopila sp. TaxID=2480087 RepID=UPI002C134A4C|nr:class I SAM-dependent methyltransferase [Rhodopila sp.]HVZ08552.1 class I SAM-dependent methyltransferase [Rhodopila sp.]